MAKDYGEMEREFIAGLKADTGRDLAEWMAAIAAEGFTNKNDTIDWLRAQGFIFNWASWLERIHANGGRPIYADKPAVVQPKKPAAAQRPSVRPPPAEAAVKGDDTSLIVPSPVVPEARTKQQGEGQGGGDRRALNTDLARHIKTTGAGIPPTPDPSPHHAEGVSSTRWGGGLAAQPTPPTPATPDDPRLDVLIAAAKGYQPLYRLLAAEIAKALPQVRISAAGTYISLGRPAEFGAIETGPKGLRLALDLGDQPFEPPLQPAKLAGPPKRLSHMIVLDDARRVDARLMELIKAADARVNP